MNKTKKWIVIGALAALGTLPGQAQVTNVYFVQNLNVALRGYSQASTSDEEMRVNTIRVTTKDLINAMGGSSRARLLVLSPVGDGDVRFVLRDSSGGNNVDTDVTAFFTQDTLGEPVERSKTNPRNGRITGNVYSINAFNFGAVDQQDNPILVFALQGFTTTTLNNFRFISNANGTGVVDGKDAVVQGTITTSGGKTETQIVLGEGQ
jgi:hypothetical protein